VADWFVEEGRGTELLKGKRVLELGSGVGLVGLCCAMLGAEVTLTDGAESLMGMLQENIESNADAIAARGGSTRGVLLEWSNGQHMMRVAAEHGPFDWIVGSDLAYDTNLHPFLADTIGMHSLTLRL
jgi:predicted nicotinamide N-methyase